MFAALLLVLLNTLPLIELSLHRDTRQADMWSASPEVSLDVYANANGHSVQQELQVQATPAAELDTGSLSENCTLARGCGKRIISEFAFQTNINSLDPVLMASEKESLDIFVNTVCPAFKCNLQFVLIRIIIFKQ